MVFFSSVDVDIMSFSLETETMELVTKQHHPPPADLKFLYKPGMKQIFYTSVQNTDVIVYLEPSWYPTSLKTMQYTFLTKGDDEENWRTYIERSTDTKDGFDGVFPLNISDKRFLLRRGIINLYGIHEAKYLASS